MSKECLYCYSEIPEKARKCKYCLEWQDEFNKESQDESIKDNSLELNEALLRKPFQLRIIARLPIHNLVSVFVLVIIMFAIIQLLWIRLDEDRIYLLTFLTYSVQLMTSWYGIIWAYRLINENSSYFIRISSTSRDASTNSFIKYQNLAFNSTFAISFGIIVGLIAAIGDWAVGSPFNSFEAKIIFAIFEFVNMTFAGAAIYSLAIIAFFLRNISLRRDDEISESIGNNDIEAIGQLHLKTSILMIFPLLLGVIARFFGNWPWEILIIIWYGAFVVIEFIYIFWPMIHIHRLMIENKDNQLHLIANQVHSLIIEIRTHPSSRNFSRLYQLRELESSISKQSTWPFDTRSLSAAFIAIIFPVILIIIDKIWAI